MPGLSIDTLPDLPESPQEARITDKFDYPVAYNFAFAGFGQGGGRIANTFASMGYSRVCAVNTTIADLSELPLPETSKLDVGNARGAGKDPEAAQLLVSDKGGDIFDLYKRTWGNDVDHVFICVAAAGGTGAGCFAKGLEVAREYMTSLKKDVKVGVIVALPKDSEGQRYAINAMHTFKQLRSLGKISPLIFIDNEQYRLLYPTTPATQEKPRSNIATAQLLHAFNRIAGLKSSDMGGATFDRADFAKLLDSGIVAFAAHKITEWASPSDFSGPIRDRLKQNCLASIDISRGSQAGLLYGLGGKAYDEVTVEHLDHGTQAMTRLMGNAGKPTTVFTGMYQLEGGDVISVMAMIGGLPWPTGRIEALGAAAGIRGDELADFLKV